MIEQKFAVAQLGVAPPCYGRMVDRASECGMEEDPLEARAQMIHDRLLAPGEDGAISLWLVRDAIDLARVALALNSTRASLTTGILFFGIEPSRLHDHELRDLQAKFRLRAADARAPTVARVFASVALDNWNTKVFSVISTGAERAPGARHSGEINTERQGSALPLRVDSRLRRRFRSDFARNDEAGARRRVDNS
jgi:hypothetical protein